MSRGGGGRSLVRGVPMRGQRIVKHTLNSVIDILNLTPPPFFIVFSLKCDPFHCVQSESTLSSVVNQNTRKQYYFSNSFFKNHLHPGCLHRNQMDHNKRNRTLRIISTTRLYLAVQIQKSGLVLVLLAFLSTLFYLCS